VFSFEAIVDSLTLKGWSRVYHSVMTCFPFLFSRKGKSKPNESFDVDDGKPMNWFNKQ
jgi:hypothetical protein